MSKLIAYYGSAFNPPHLGHMDAIAQALTHFDEVCVSPSRAHPFGKQMAPLSHRKEMLRVAIAETFGTDGRVWQTDVEERIERVPVYTYDVLAQLKAEAACRGEQHQYVFVLGPDNAEPATWQKFYRYAAIEREFGTFRVAERKPVRSTQCRRMLAKPNEGAALQKLLPPGVLAYLQNSADLYLD